MRTLDVPEYTPPRTRCNTPFLGFLRSFSHKTPMRDAPAPPYPRDNSFTSFSTGPLRGPSYFYTAFSRCAGAHPPPAWPQCPHRRLRSRRDPLTLPPRFTLSPLFTVAAFSVSFCLLQEKYKKNETTNENPLPYFTLSLSAGVQPLGLSLA